MKFERLTHDGTRIEDMPNGQWVPTAVLLRSLRGLVGFIIFLGVAMFSSGA
jgi:hypothetical protein